MPEPSQTLRGYVNDMIAAHRHVLEAITRHAEEPAVSYVPGAQPLLAQAVVVLDRHINILDRRVADLGGSGAVGGFKEALTSVTGFLTGLYGQIRSETASRILRDDYAGFSFLLICASMLHTTAAALRDEKTAAISRAIMNDLPPLILRLNELVPQAVAIDLARDHPDEVIGADATTTIEIKDAWRRAAPAHPR